MLVAISIVMALLLQVLSVALPVTAQTSYSVTITSHLRGPNNTLIAKSVPITIDGVITPFYTPTNSHSTAPIASQYCMIR